MSFTVINEAYRDANRLFCLTFCFKILKFRSYIPKQKTIDQLPVVQKLDSAIHRINRYPEDRYYDNQLRCPLDSDLSSW